MRKSIFLLLAVIFAALLLSGCGRNGGSETEPETAELTEETAVPSTNEATEAESTAESTGPVEADRATAQAAIVETALAYLRKNPYTQYEARSMTIESPQFGPGRLNQYAAPEYASADQYYYAQCTQFLLDVLHNTFGWEFWGNVKEPHTELGSYWATYDNGGLVYMNKELTADTLEAELAKYREMLQPGDIVVSYSSRSAGHAMMFLGDCKGDGKDYMIHCWGTYNKDITARQNDVAEKNGAIYLQTADSLLFKSGGSPNWDLHTHAATYLALYRFLDDKDFQAVLTPAAEGRLRYPQITVDRFVEGVNQYQDLPAGAGFTVTTSVTNSSKEDYKGLKITECLPEEGAELLPGETLEWTVDVPAGKTVTVSYQAKVTAERGTVLLFPASLVDTIPARTLELKVSGTQLTEAQRAAIAVLAEAVPPVEGTDLAYIKGLYQAVLGIELDLPDTTQELLKLLFKTKNGLSGERMLKPLEETAENRSLLKMILREHLSGIYVTNGADGTNRVMQYEELNYQPGDLFFVLSGLNKIAVIDEEYTSFYLYLGDGKVLKISRGEASVSSFADTVECCLYKNCVIAVRPTLALDDAASVPVPEQKTVMASVTMLAELEEKIGKLPITVTGEIRLEKPLEAGRKPITVAAGGKLELGDFDILDALELTVEEGGSLTASGTGRLVIGALSYDALAPYMERYAGLPVRIEAADSATADVFDLKDRIMIFREELSAGATALSKGLKLIGDGWTVEMDNWYASSSENFVFPKECKIDLHGQYLMLNQYGNANLTVTDTVGGGYFGFRGSESGVSINYTGDIYAPGIPFTVGYLSKTKGTESAAKVEMKGKLTYGSLTLLYGSELLGDLVQAD